MTDIEHFLTIYGHSGNLLDNKLHYSRARICYLTEIMKHAGNVLSQGRLRPCNLGINHTLNFSLWPMHQQRYASSYRDIKMER